MIPAVFLCVLSMSYVSSHKLSESGCSEGFYGCSGYNAFHSKYVYLKCIAEDLICNGINNCYFGEDEEDCEPTSIYTLRTTITKPTSLETTERITMPTSTSLFESTSISPTEETTIDTSTISQSIFDVTTLLDTTIFPTSDGPTTTVNDTLYFSTEESITTRLIDTDTSDMEDKANRDYKALIISIIISILISLMFVTCVLIHWKLARRRKRSQMSTGNRFRMTHRKHANNPA